MINNQLISNQQQQQPIENLTSVPTTSMNADLNNDIFSKQKPSKLKSHRKSTKDLFIERLNRIFLLVIIPLLLIFCKSSFVTFF